MIKKIASFSRLIDTFRNWASRQLKASLPSEYSSDVMMLEQRIMLSASPIDPAMLDSGAIDAAGSEMEVVASDSMAVNDEVSTQEGAELLNDQHDSGSDGADVHDDEASFDIFGNEYHALTALPVQESGTADPSASPDAAAPFALADTFQLHSNPDASHTIYLDFDGHVTSGTVWNSSFNGGSDIVTAAYDFDGNTSSFSDSELERIQYIWQRVAEDFIPFDVNVTTEDPGAASLIKSGGGDVEWGTRVVIGGSSSDWYGASAGGVAYLGSFNWSSDTPAFVFEAQLGNGNEKYTAEAISHEIGHTLGLSHDGSSSTSYYSGHGSGETGWAPIMGVGYYENLSQWSRGEYLNANNSQDDLSIITSNNGFDYRVDDHGDLHATASLLNLAGSSVVDQGIIEQNNDVDVFSFTADAGQLDLQIDAVERGPNLDILAELYDASSTLIAWANPSGFLDAALSLSVTAGQYFLHVTGVGEGDPLATGYTDYGSLGQYFVSGTVVPTSSSFVSISATDAVKQEGDSGTTELTFTVTRSGDTSGSMSVDYAVAGGNTDPADAADFFGGVLPTGTVNFNAGEVSKIITIAASGDTLVENDEQFTVQLANASGSTQIVNDSAGGTILNDDSTPSNDEFLAITATSADKLEGDAGSTQFTFTVTRSGDTSGSTTVDYAVIGSTTNAADASDFSGGVLPGGTVTFAAGEVSKVISVQVAADTQVESDEGFTVQLSNASGVAQITTDSASGTIRNDDVAATPGFTVTPTSGLTTKEQGSTASFSVVLDSQPDQNVVVDVVSLDTTEGLVSTNQLVFTAANWSTAQTVIVTGVDDSVRDGHVTYTVQLTSAETNQGGYATVDPDDVQVTNQDNEKGKKGGGGSGGGGGGGGGGGKGKGGGPKKGPAVQEHFANVLQKFESAAAEGKVAVMDLDSGFASGYGDRGDISSPFSRGPFSRHFDIHLGESSSDVDDEESAAEALAAVPAAD